MAQQNTLTIPGRYDQIRRITQFIKDGGRAAGLDEDALFHLELCVDEAASNIIEHAYGGEDVGPISVRYETRCAAFVVIMCDNGRPFNPKKVPEPKSIDQAINSLEPALSDYLDSLQVGGLGIYFMRQLMDEVHYSFDDQEGNKLTLVKYLPAERDL